MTQPARADGNKTAAPRIDLCEVDFHVTAPDGPLSSPEMLLQALRREILPVLSEVLEAPPFATVDVDIAQLEIDLGRWPDDPDWSDLRLVMGHKLRQALAPYLTAPLPRDAANTVASAVAAAQPDVPAALFLRQPAGRSAATEVAADHRDPDNDVQAATGRASLPGTAPSPDAAAQARKRLMRHLWDLAAFPDDDAGALIIALQTRWPQLFRDASRPPPEDPPLRHDRAATIIPPTDFARQLQARLSALFHEAELSPGCSVSQAGRLAATLTLRFGQDVLVQSETDHLPIGEPLQVQIAPEAQHQDEPAHPSNNRTAPAMDHVTDSEAMPTRIARPGAASFSPNAYDDPDRSLRDNDDMKAEIHAPLLAQSFRAPRQDRSTDASAPAAAIAATKERTRAGHPYASAPDRPDSVRHTYLSQSPSDAPPQIATRLGRLANRAAADEVPEPTDGAETTIPRRPAEVTAVAATAEPAQISGIPGTSSTEQGPPTGRRAEPSDAAVARADETNCQNAPELSFRHADEAVDDTCDDPAAANQAIGAESVARDPTLPHTHQNAPKAEMKAAQKLAGQTPQVSVADQFPVQRPVGRSTALDSSVSDPPSANILTIARAVLLRAEHMHGAALRARVAQLRTADPAHFSAAALTEGGTEGRDRLMDWLNEVLPAPNAPRSGTIGPPATAEASPPTRPRDDHASGPSGNAVWHKAAGREPTATESLTPTAPDPIPNEEPDSTAPSVPDDDLINVALQRLDERDNPPPAATVLARLSRLRMVEPARFYEGLERAAHAADADRLLQWLDAESPSVLVRLLGSTDVSSAELRRIWQLQRTECASALALLTSDEIHRLILKALAPRAAILRASIQGLAMDLADPKPALAHVLRNLLDSAPIDLDAARHAAGPAAAISAQHSVPQQKKTVASAPIEHPAMTDGRATSPQHVLAGIMQAVGISDSAVRHLLASTAFGAAEKPRNGDQSVGRPSPSAGHDGETRPSIRSGSLAGQAGRFQPVPRTLKDRQRPRDPDAAAIKGGQSVRRSRRSGSAGSDTTPTDHDDVAAGSTPSGPEGDRASEQAGANQLPLIEQGHRVADADGDPVPPILPLADISLSPSGNEAAASSQRRNEDTAQNPVDHQYSHTLPQSDSAAGIAPIEPVEQPRSDPESHKSQVVPAYVREDMASPRARDRGAADRETSPRPNQPTSSPVFHPFDPPTATPDMPIAPADIEKIEALLDAGLDPDGQDLRDALSLIIAAWPAVGGSAPSNAAARHANRRRRGWHALLERMLETDPEVETSDTLPAALEQALRRIEPEDANRDQALRYVIARLGLGAQDRPSWRGADAALRLRTRRALAQLLGGTPDSGAPRRDAAPRDAAPQPDLVVTECAGVVLLHPFLRLLFDRMGLLTPQGQIQTGHLPMTLTALHALDGRAGRRGFDPLHRLLLGMPPGAPPPEPVPLSDTSRDLIEGLLRSVIAQWGRLGQTSPDGLRASFLQRAGTLRMDETGAHLRVTPGPFDMLLDALPWSIGLIKLPWMAMPCRVRWRERDE